MLFSVKLRIIPFEWSVFSIGEPMRTQTEKKQQQNPHRDIKYINQQLKNRNNIFSVVAIFLFLLFCFVVSSVFSFMPCVGWLFSAYLSVRSKK